MTVDLACLVAFVLWGVVLAYVEVAGKTRAGGLAWNAGNRDQDPVVPPWVGRAGRALANHKENAPLFLVAVLVVHLAGRPDGTSAAASIAFVIARVLHGVIYIAGIEVAKARSLAYVGALVAVGVLLSRLVIR